MMSTSNAARRAALLFCLSAPLAAPAAPTPGFDATTNADARSRPVHLVTDHARLRPQIAYGYMGIPNVQVYSPGMSMGQAVGVGLAGGLIAGALINGAEYAAAVDAAQRPYATLRAAQCDLPVDARLADSMQAALAAAWPDAAVTRHVGEQPADAEKAAARSGPHTQVHLQATFSPDFSTLVVFADATGETGTRAPQWRERLMSASIPVDVPAEKSADIIATLVDAENARHAALDLGPEIARVNKLGRSATRDDRKPLEDALARHASALKDARRPAWTPSATAQWRALQWSADGCARVRAALDTGVDEVAHMAARMADGTLDAQAEDYLGRTAATEARRIYRLGTGAYVQQRPVDAPSLGFVGTLLKD